MSDGKPLLSRRLDRRAFLGGAAVAAGAVVAGTLVPLSLVPSAEASIALTPIPGDPAWDGHVDDACGHWPPYSYAIPYNAVRAPEVAVADAFAANVHPADYFLIG